jgi:hypothetical protein
MSSVTASKTEEFLYFRFSTLPTLPLVNLNQSLKRSSDIMDIATEIGCPSPLPKIWQWFEKNAKARGHKK